MSNGIPSKEESARLDKVEETLKNLSSILMDNLNINRENVDAINDSVKAAKGLADPYTLSASAAKEIKKSTQDIATLASKVAKDEDTILNRRRSSKDIAKDLAKSTQEETSL